MLSEFREFVDFIQEITSDYPSKLVEFFRDIFIYVPDDKIPPKFEYMCPAATKPTALTVSLQKYFANQTKDFCELTYNEGWDQLEEHLGPDLLRFCLTECIFAKKTNSGAFMVSNLSNLCKKIPVNPPEKLSKRFYHTAKCQEESTDDLLVSRDDKINEWEKLQKNLIHLFCTDDIDISTDANLFKTSSSRKFPDGHVLVKKNSMTTMSSQVINTRVGNKKIVQYEDCMEPLELLLKKLKKAHSKYNYEKALNRLISSNTVASSGEKTIEHHNSRNQLPLPVLKKYFNNIFNHVIPRELFGSNKNRNTVIKIICHLLETPQYQSINLRSYILKMRVSEIRWLDGVKNSDAQWTILGKLLKWFFKNYVLEIFRTQLYVMVTNSKEKIYFKQIDWQKLTTEFIKKMSRDKVIARVNGITTKVSCNGRWILFPKKNGVRPIMSRVGGSEVSENTKLALCFLQQLHITKYGESGKQIFIEKWRNLVDKFRNERNTTMYLVCCDIQNAYGAIDQNKLLAIVESLAHSAGPQLSLKWYKISKNINAVKSNCSRSKKCFKYPELELPVHSKSIFACGSDKVVKVRTKVLLREIKKNVLMQNILISNQRYLLQKGIAQGAILSTALCDLYYAHMVETNLSEFKDKGLLCRYVDDFLFATEDKALAERFLQYVHKGCPDYNCSFNAAKTRTNLPGYEHTMNDITYLGYNIHPKTLEVTSDFSKSPRYTTVLSKPRYQILQTFHKRLSNLASLKIDGMVLDLKINSEDTIIHNVNCMFKRQAERCLWLLSALFDDISSQLSEIFKIIRSTNLQIFRRIHRYFLTHGYNFESLVPRLLVLPWKSYRQVFGKKPSIHVHFRSLFLKSIKMNEHDRAN
ncbi:telomerase reverse transcriptase-like isoform X1 [Neodiprion virginianus]|uniref:telomerase reverse transcriptase-like isoform X1 n=2 Tax=Neodiprion virginianus TaxID=2961670 RepID=UPI001EE768CB|nr:telomerase reverse transcriptase-like isoform X1 [Neodiprion virginianus]